MKDQNTYIDEKNRSNSMSEELGDNQAEFDNKLDNQERLERLKARREFRKSQIIMGRLRSFARFASIILLIWALCSLVNSKQWYLPKSLFSKYPSEALFIEGNDIIRSTQVLSAIKGIQLPDRPIYLIDTTPIKEALSKLSPIKKVYIRRYGFPARIKVVIKEKTPILSIAAKPNALPTAVFMKDSSIIGREYLPLDSSKNVRKVLTYGNFYKWSKKHVNYLAYLVKTIEDYSNENLHYLDIRNADDIYAKIDSANIRLGELNTTVFDRAKRISSVLPQTLELKDKIEYIDLRWDNSTFIKLKNKDKNRIKLND